MSVFLRRCMALVCAMMLFAGSAGAQGALNILLIGVDAARGDDAGRSDTMMLAQVDASNGAIRLVSFLRDLYLPVPGHGSTRLNAAYTYGGETLLKQTLEKNFDIRIDRTVTVNFAQLAQLVDELGGVELEMTEAERRHLNHLLEDFGDQAQPVESAGLQTLTGLQALCFSRIRKIDNDFQRTARQQMLIQAMLKKMSEMDRWSLLKMAVRHLGMVETDVGFSDLTRLAPLINSFDEMDLQTAHVPFEGTYTDEVRSGMMVLLPNLQANTRELKHFLGQ